MFVCGWLLAARWCVVNKEEMDKCNDLVEALQRHGRRDLETQIGAHAYKYEDMPQLQCVMGTDQYDCMQKIFENKADLIELGTGLSYTAGEYYNMIPLVAEKYMLGLLPTPWRLCNMRLLFIY